MDLTNTQQAIAAGFNYVIMAGIVLTLASVIMMVISMFCAKEDPADDDNGC